MQVKTCFRCHLSKPITEFQKHSQTKDGRRPECKECDRQRRQRPEVAAAIREHREATKPEIAAYGKTYRQRNRQKIQAYFRELRCDPEHRAKHTAYVAARNAEPVRRERRRQYLREYVSRPGVRERRRELEANRRANNPTFRLSKDFSRYVSRSLAKAGGKRHAH